MGQATPFDQRLTEMLLPTVEAMGFELIRVRLQGSADQMRTLQIMAERPDGSMNVNDCAELSRAVSAALDVEDPIDGAYHLEVSSPGIDRPLTREKDFVNWTGFEAKLELTHGIEGRRRFKGRLKGFENGNVLIDAQDADGSRVVMPLAFSDLAEARLVITDDLLAAASKAADGGIGQGQDIDEMSGLEFDDPDADLAYDDEE